MKLSFEEVVNIAMEFIKNAGHFHARIEKVKPVKIPSGNFAGRWIWTVLIDVGATKQIIKKIIILDDTGKIVKYE